MAQSQQRGDNEDEPTRLGVDRDTNAVLIAADTAVDVFADGDEMVIDETAAEDGYISLTGVESDTRVTLQFRPQQEGEEA